MKYLFVLISCFFILGCSASSTDSTYNGDTNENIQSIKTNTQRDVSSIEVSNNIIKTSLGLITENTNKIETSVVSNPALLDGIRPFLNDIRNNSEIIKRQTVSIDNYIADIRILSDRLDLASSDVLKLRNNILQLKTTIDNLDNEKKKIEQEATKKLYSIIASMFGISFIIIVGGLACIIFYEKKLGFQIIAFGIFLLCLSAAATRFMEQISYIGLGVVVLGILGVLSLCVWSLFKKNKETETYSTATHEIVESVEALKQNLPDKLKHEFFGDKAVPGIAHSIQSKRTQGIVSEIRQNGLKKKIMPTIPINSTKGLTG